MSINCKKENSRLTCSCIMLDDAGVWTPQDFQSLFCDFSVFWKG